MLKKTLFLFFLLTVSTKSFAQLLVINEDTLHCFTRLEAARLVEVVYDRDECRELLSVSDSAIIEYQALVRDMSLKTELLSQKFVESERLSEMAVKQYKKEFRRHKLTKVGLALSVGVLAAVVVTR